MTRKRAIGKRPKPFDWVNWRFRDNDPELEQFNNQLGLTTLGAFTPGEAPTVFNPLVTMNPVPKATLLHETTHQELMRATTFGLFFEVLYSLANLPRFRKLVSLSYQHQWQVQEACATYSGLTLIAHLKPTYLAEAVRKLPSGKANQPPYREVFNELAEVVPIVEGTQKSRLQGQAIFATAIGHCSMNNDCLIRFADPEALDDQALSQYLVESSPNRRFAAILKALQGHSRLEAIIKRAQRDFTRGGVTPVRPAIAEIARLVPSVPIVQTFEEIKTQHGLFREKWEGFVDSVTPDRGPNLDASGQIPGVYLPANYGSSGPLTIGEVRKAFATAQDKGVGLWVVLNYEGKGVKLDLLPYVRGKDANPLSTETSVSAVQDVGFRGGKFEINDVVAVFDEFPDLPHAITFIRGSWFYWERACAGHVAGKKSIQACLHRGLSRAELEVMLAFRNLRKTGEYFVLKFDDDLAVAIIADPRSPGYYVLQYLAGDVGLLLFHDFAEEFGIKEMPEYVTRVPHLPLLQLMLLPEFLAARFRGGG